MKLQYPHMSPLEKYTFFSKKHTCRRPVHLYRHYSKVDIPRDAPYGYE